MQATEILVKEHDNILKVLGRVKTLLEGSMQEHSDELFFIIDFIINYSDKYHHMKEEDIYFEWISENSEGLKNGPVSCMLSEHVTFRDLTQNAKNALEHFTKDNNNQDAHDTVKASLTMLRELLSQHIDKENQMLFPMAERLNLQIKNGDDFMMNKFNDVEGQYAKDIKKFEKYCLEL